MDLLNNGLGTDCVIRFPNPDHMFWLIVPSPAIHIFTSQWCLKELLDPESLRSH